MELKLLTICDRYELGHISLTQANFVTCHHVACGLCMMCEYNESMMEENSSKAKKKICILNI